MTKVCKRCNIESSLDKFRHLPPKKMASGLIKTYRSNICTPCIVRHNKQTQKKTNEELASDARARRNARKLRAIEYLGGKCKKCDQVFHSAAFDFHHLDPSTKDRDPGLMMGYTDEKLFAELDKCILLCANCHRILHFEEGYGS